MDYLERQQQALGSGNEPHPKLVCVTGNSSMLRRLISNTLNVHFTRTYNNSYLMDATNWLNGIVWGKEMSDWAKDAVGGISTYKTVEAKKLADICIEAKRRDEFENAIWSSFKGSIDTVLWEGGHYTLILSGTTLPEREYWNDRSYKILIDSPDKTSDDANVDYSGVESDIVIHSIDEFNRESGNIIKAINEKESYGVEGRKI